MSETSMTLKRRYPFRQHPNKINLNNLQDKNSYQRKVSHASNIYFLQYIKAKLWCKLNNGDFIYARTSKWIIQLCRIPLLGIPITYCYIQCGSILRRKMMVEFIFCTYYLSVCGSIVLAISWIAGRGQSGLWLKKIKRGSGSKRPSGSIWWIR